MTNAITGQEPRNETTVVSLYEKWRKIYPLWVTGRFQRIRRVLLLVLLVVFYASPWLTWNGRQGVWFDLPNRQFTLFWTTFYPQEFVLLSWLLIIAAFSLFFFTVLAGRLWCGYACPQTVWTLCFQWVEKWVEGDRNQRLRLDRGRWSTEWFSKKLVKWSLWGLLSLSIGLTFVGYFEPPRELLAKLAAFDLVGWEWFWILFPAVGSYVLSGVLREQVCLHMCPYARFQSVMFDKDTLIISYDEERGDPRGNRPRSADPAQSGLGDCIDCKLCVHACPTGIDIRNGLQYQCIGCAQCIDACDGVMETMGYAPNLIRYSSQHSDRHEERPRIRPRLVGYGAVLATMIAAFGFSLANRVPVAVDVLRDRNRLYREIWDGSIENVYTLKVMNRGSEARTFQLDAGGDLDIELRTRHDDNRFRIEAGDQMSIPVQLIAHPDPNASTDANTSVEFSVETIDAPHFVAREQSRFVTPERESKK